jgi:chitodextrinase
LAGYNVYIKTGVGSYELNQTLGVQNNYTITGLTQNTSYDIKVTAFDEAGNESVLADATEVTQSTGNSSDVQAPSIPQNLTLDIIGATEATVSWTASTDNVGVALYNVYVDDVLQTPTDSNTFYSITGLVVDTTYEVSVSAQDAAGNESAKSTPITITTTGSL